MAGVRDGSLLGTIDRTVTAAGARLLADDLASPLTDKGAILDRLDLVDALARDALWRADLRAALRALPDAGRALGHLVAGRGGPIWRNFATRSAVHAFCANGLRCAPICRRCSRLLPGSTVMARWSMN